MPEFVLDSRGRKRSAAFSVAECKKLTDRINGFERLLGLDLTPPEDSSWTAFLALRSRLEGACASKASRWGAKKAQVTVVGLSGAKQLQVKQADKEACGRRMVDWDGKTTACLMSMPEFRLFSEWLEDLDDSVELHEARSGGGHFTELHQVLQDLGLESPDALPG